MSIDQNDYIIETIKIGEEECKRIWVLERQASLSEPSFVTMYVQIVKSMLKVRGEECAL